MYRIQKKRKGIAFYVLLFLCAFSVGLGIGYGVIKQNTAKKQHEFLEESGQTPPVTTATPNGQPASLNMVVPAETPQPSAQYFVITQDGTVCVFTLDENGNQRFSHKLAIELDALPEIDQKLFTEGFYVYSKQELLELTEDFSS